MRTLEGKAAIVTGAASGIGRATAGLFAERGAKVVAADWNEAAGREAVEEIRQGGGEDVFCHADVSQARDVERMVRFAVERYGRLDILVSNAAVQILGQLTETSEEDWDKVIDVNLKSMFLTCKYVFPYMEKQRSGCIINIASVAGIRSGPVPSVAYAA
ncbi:MAG: SDR family NAD(P)-dependent oxidoreductase, partial [Bryobacteraceae bacterium]|nr:SDR family NAD(P)-dependent oxidoreductase [Bryobacteraceae bacterium]